MVSLTMMGRLLEALRPDSQLVLVGDPRQLTSVGAGAVLSDLVAGYDGRADSPVAALTENFPAPRRTSKALAAALLTATRTRCSPCCAPRPTRCRSSRRLTRTRRQVLARLAFAAALRDPAGGPRRGPRACARRARPLPAPVRPPRGPSGVRRWNHLVERWLAEDPDVDPSAPWVGGGTSAGRCW